MSELVLEKLQRRHAIETFDCGQDALNRYLINHAWANQQAKAAQTYIARSGEAVIGYYTLVVGEVAFENAADRLRKGLGRYPVPVMVLARLAIALDWQGKGIGAGLLRDAVLRTLAAADIAGIRAIIVHAKDERSRAFYERYGFAPSPTDPLHLFALLKDIAWAR